MKDNQEYENGRQLQIEDYLQENMLETEGNVEVPWVRITQPSAATNAQNMYSSNYVESDLINSYAWDTAIVFIQKYSGNTNYANQRSVNTSKLKTGLSGDKACNVYDMASNCREWTTEYSTYMNASNSSPSVIRGGLYSSRYLFTSHRVGITTTDSHSFRSLIYLK